MLDGIKRWWSRPPTTAAAVSQPEDLAAWAAARQCSFRPVRDSEGFVIDGRLGALPWRLEWGPSQRGYIKGMELRLRAELGLSSDVHALVLDRSLQEAMEHAVYEQFVEGVQTRIDDQTPPEMRWLVMFPKLGGDVMKSLRERFTVLGSGESFLQPWLEGSLTEALEAMPVAADQPMVLMIARGRLTLRAALATPTVLDLQHWLRLFETAMREARRVASQIGDASAPSTQPSLWTASALPSDDERP